MTITTRWLEKDGLFEATDPDWPGCAGYGATRAEAKRDFLTQLKPSNLDSKLNVLEIKTSQTEEESKDPNITEHDISVQKAEEIDAFLRYTRRDYLMRLRPRLKGWLRIMNNTYEGPLSQDQRRRLVHEGNWGELLARASEDRAVQFVSIEEMGLGNARDWKGLIQLLKRRRQHISRLTKEPYTRRALERAHNFEKFFWDLLTTLTDFESPEVSPRSSLRDAQQDESDCKAMIGHLHEALRLYNAILNRGGFGIRYLPEEEEYLRKIDELDPPVALKLDRFQVQFPGALIERAIQVAEMYEPDIELSGLPHTVSREDVAKAGPDRLHSTLTRALFRLRDQTDISETEYDAYVAAWLRCAGFTNIKSDWVRGIRLKGHT